jgi:ABC-type nitrate/sulfonate/bicarbonate transport system substrate-binding protein
MVGLATSNGLDWSKQQGTAIGAATAWIPTISSGQCDLSAMGVDAAASLTNKGQGYVVTNLNDPAIEKDVYGGIIMGTILQTNPSFADKYPALTQAIVGAFTKGLLYVQEHSDDAQAIYTHTPSEYTKTITPELFAQAWETAKATYASNTGLFDAEQIASTTKFLVSVKQIKDTDTLPKTAYTNAYTDNAYKELGVNPGAASTAPTTTP